MDSGDGRIERELHPTPLQEEVGVASGEWLVAITTSDLRGAGTDANVSIQVSNLLVWMDVMLYKLHNQGPCTVSVISQISKLLHGHGHGCETLPVSMA